MRKNCATYFIAAFLAAVSCSKSETPSGESPFSDGTVFIGENRMIETKITLGTESAGKIPALWEPDDKIAVYGSDNASKLATGTLCSGAGTSTGSFECDALIPSGTDVRIVYPSTADYAGKHSLPYAQTGTPGESDLSQYCFAYSDKISVGGDNTFCLQHAPVYMRLKLSSTGYAAYKLNSFVFQCEGTPLSGNYSIDYSTGDITTYSDAADAVTVTLSSPMTISETKDVWFAVLPADLTGKKLLMTLNLTTPAGVIQKVAIRFSGRSLTRGHIYTLKITNPTIDWIEEADLSKAEYTTSTLQWKKSLGDKTFLTKPAYMATGMNWMDKVRNGYSAQDSWGGDMSVEPDYIVSSNPAGFWRVGRYGGTSVMVTPDNHICFLRGMNNVTPEPKVEASTATSAARYNATWATDEDFALQAGQWMRDLGFNFYCAGAARIIRYPSQECSSDGKVHYCSPQMEQYIQHPDAETNISQCENLYLMRTFFYDQSRYTDKSSGKDIPLLAFCFDPGWLDYIDDIASKAAAMFRDNRNFVGYFFDNELAVCGVNSSSLVNYTSTLKNFLDCCKEEYTIAAGYHRVFQYARQWTLDWMNRNYGTTTYSSSMEEAFQAEIFDYYFRTCTEAIRRHDPNHLILGTRINAPNRNTESYMRACARYCDVVSINYYGHVLEPEETLVTIKSWLGNTPFLISEMYAKGLDVQTFNEGAGDFVATQADRGKFWNTYCYQMTKFGNCAGVMWFKFWNDYNNAGAGWVNKGIMDYNDYSKLYTDCTSLMADYNRNAIQVLKYFHGKNSTSDTEGCAGSLQVVDWN